MINTNLQIRTLIIGKVNLPKVILLVYGKAKIIRGFSDADSKPDLFYLCFSAVATGDLLKHISKLSVERGSEMGYVENMAKNVIFTLFSFQPPQSSGLSQIMPSFPLSIYERVV